MGCRANSLLIDHLKWRTGEIGARKMEAGLASTLVVTRLGEKPEGIALYKLVRRKATIECRRRLIHSGRATLLSPRL